MGTWWSDGFRKLNMDNLSKRHCEACRVGSLPVTDSELKIFSENFKEWELLNENGIRKIKKQFKFPNFQEALSFTIKMGKLSEEQGHHPLLTDYSGKGFGKRLGSLSIKNLNEDGFENITILNYLSTPK